MSRIDELIAELCPDGVPFLAVGEVTTRTSNVKWASTSDATFQYIDLSSVDRVTRRINDTATITADTAPSRAQQIVKSGDVIFATTRPTQMRWAVISSSYDEQIVSTGYCVLRPVRSRVLTNFLAHLLGTETFRLYVELNQVAGNYPAIADGRIRDYRIPVPPLEVQQEIVRILDQFTALEAELESELNAELEARRDQYAYYRDQLLSFPEAGVRWIPMGELGAIFRGKRFTKADYVESGGIGVIHYGEIYTAYRTKTTKVVSRVRGDLGPFLRYARKGDVVFTDVGETVEDVGKPVAWLGDEDVAVHDHCYVVRSSIDATYLSYVMQASRFLRAKDQHIARTKVKTLLLDGLKRIIVPVPPLEEQRRIVAILDQFDALVNDLSVGLPAELAARRQQYEYYRDKLLTFAEAS